MLGPSRFLDRGPEAWRLHSPSAVSVLPFLLSPAALPGKINVQTAITGVPRHFDSMKE
jgi:hypothetical protein